MFLAAVGSQEILTSKPKLKREAKDAKKGIAHGLEIPECFVPEGKGIYFFELFFLQFILRKNSVSNLCDYSNFLELNM